MKHPENNGSNNKSDIEIKYRRKRTKQQLVTQCTHVYAHAHICTAGRVTENESGEKKK